MTTGNTLFDTLNPIQSEIPTTEKIIRLIVIVFGGLFLYGLIKDFGTHLSYIRDIHRFPFDSITYLLPFLFFPTGIFFFWKRKSIGWTLLVIFLIFSIVSVLSSLIGSFSWKQSNFDGLSKFFLRPDPIKLIPQLIFL